MHSVYLDNNATTRIAPAVLGEMLPYYTDHFGNASSLHAFGEGPGAAIRLAREQVRALIGAGHAHEIVFTSGGTESNNSAILSALETQPERNEIIVSAVEHPAILSLAAHLQKHRAVFVRTIPVDRKGRINMSAYKAALSPQTAIASIMWANNETGIIHPVAELAHLAHEAGVLFHTDAVQAAGRVPISAEAAEIDMLSLSAHKFHGPKGVGALYIKKGVCFDPLIRGGKQERGRRAGTENTPGIVGLGKAAELARQRLEGSAWKRVQVLRNRFEALLMECVDGCEVLGHGGNRLPNTSNVLFDGAEGEVIISSLNKAGIAASSGSACTSGATEPSHVLRAMKVPLTAAIGAIRFSFSQNNTDGDIARVLAVLPAIVEKAREASGFAVGAGPERGSGVIYS